MVAMGCVGNFPRKPLLNDTTWVGEGVVGGVEHAAFPIHQLALYGNGDSVGISAVEALYITSVEITGIDDLCYRILLDDVPISHVCVNPCDGLCVMITIIVVFSPARYLI